MMHNQSDGPSFDDAQFRLRIGEVCDVSVGDAIEHVPTPAEECEMGSGKKSTCVLFLLTPILAAPAVAGTEIPATGPTGGIQHALAMITPGMTRDRIDEVVRSERGMGGWADSDWAVQGTGFSRFDFGGGQYLLVRYSDTGSEIRPDTKAASAEVIRIDDLLKKVPPEVAPGVRLIHLAPSAEGERFDPVALVRAVNGLLPLGKSKALQALRDYGRLRQTDFQTQWQYDIDVQRVFLVAELLFVPKDGKSSPPVVLGQPAPDLGRSAANWPLFPLAVQDDLPFCLVSGYSLFGTPVSPADYLDACERACVLRPRELAPRVSPGAAAEALFESDRWRRSLHGQTGEAQVKYLVRRQALLGVRNLWTQAPDWSFLDPERGGHVDDVWAGYLRSRLFTGVRWDGTAQRFVHADGS